MAVWHYEVALVPRAGIIRHHAGIPEELPGYRAIWNPEEGADEMFPNYWVDSLPEHLAEEIRGILPQFESWSDDALMFGKNETNRIVIRLGHDLDFRFDLREPDWNLLRWVAEFAQAHDLFWVSG